VAALSAADDRVRGSVFVLTDYGLTDELAGVLRAVIVREAPLARIVDLTHAVPAFDVLAGALALVRAVPHLGPGVVVGVVDPGVASDRKAVAVESRSVTGPRHLVGPDNGLLVWAAELLGGVADAVELSRPAKADGGATFDGRDVFAPAAAGLWSGKSLRDLGEPMDPAELVRLRDPLLSVADGAVDTEVVWVDGFGNVQLSAGPDDALRADLGDPVEVVIGNACVTARRVVAFCELEPGELGLIVDSNGRLALAGDRESAAHTLGLHAGDTVTLRSQRR
jgi:S-adenosylmethionine hydrolase